MLKFIIGCILVCVATIGIAQTTDRSGTKEKQATDKPVKDKPAREPKAAPTPTERQKLTDNYDRAITHTQVVRDNKGTTDQMRDAVAKEKAAKDGLEKYNGDPNKPLK